MTKLTIEEVAQIAYQAYGTVTDFKNYQGLPMPKWNELTPKIQEAWRAAALAAINSVRPQQIQIGGSNNKQSIT